MNNSIYVIGHKNPDSDSICSALAYAEMKRLLGENAIACRLGPLNEESKYILKRFGFENPLLMKDARTQLRDITLEVPTFITRKATVKEAWELMLSKTVKSLYVMDENNHVEGIVTASNLAMTRMLLPEDQKHLMQGVDCATLARTINGEVKYNPPVFSANGEVYIVTLYNSDAFKNEFKNSICILSDAQAKQKQLIEQGAKCLVISCGQKVSDSVKQMAAVHGCAIITTPLDTMNVAKYINEAITIDQIMTKNPICFKETDFVQDVLIQMAKSRVRSYPVVNADNEVIGSVSRYTLQGYQKKQFILVDHSSKAQAINNIDRAEVIEIIDHHNIGNIETDKAIMYRNMRVGCTCTIISLIYQENGLLPDERISGLLLSAILSDTLNFKSATTTELDKITASWLAKRAGIESIDKYAEEMLGASVALKDSSPHEILNRDLKAYKIGQYNIAIGQTNYQHMKDVQALLPEFKENMKKEQKEKKLDLLVMAFTHVMASGSYLLFYGPLSYVMAEKIQTVFDEHSGYDADIISRKQQLVPMLSQILSEM